MKGLDLLPAKAKSRSEAKSVIARPERTRPKNKDILSACASQCPHAGGQMADGHIDALGNIVCPLHRYKFSLQNGGNVTGEGYFLKTYPVEIREEGIFIGIEEKSGLFGW